MSRGKVSESTLGRQGCSRIKNLAERGFEGADEGTRTLDLLHGKQTL
jgi:hypothetical protein